MTMLTTLNREKIVSLSELQKNPSRALDGEIIRIVKNGKEVGIFLNNDAWTDLMEEFLPLKPSFKKELNARLKKFGKLKPLAL